MNRRDVLILTDHHGDSANFFKEEDGSLVIGIDHRGVAVQPCVELDAAMVAALQDFLAFDRREGPDS